MLHHGFAVVAAAGTATPLAATRTLASWITIQPRSVSGGTNQGEIRIGGVPSLPSNGGVAGQKNIPTGSGFRIKPGDSAVAWAMPAVNPLDLNTTFIDADTNGDGVQFIYGTT